MKQLDLFKKYRKWRGERKSFAKNNLEKAESDKYQERFAKDAVKYNTNPYGGHQIQDWERELWA